jgi:phage baseplate assembly protein gpV
VTLKKAGGKELTYEYIPKGGSGWAFYEGSSYEFPSFELRFPDGTTESYDYKTHNKWNLKGQVPAETQLVLETIIAITDFVPFSKSLTTTLVISIAVLIIWVGMQTVILPNILSIGSNDPKKKALGYAMMGGVITAVDKNKEFINDK